MQYTTGLQYVGPPCEDYAIITLVVTLSILYVPIYAHVRIQNTMGI